MAFSHKVLSLTKPILLRANNKHRIFLYMIKKHYFPLVFVFTGTLLLSCRHDPVMPAADTNTEVCFQSQIQPLINANCAVSGCHDGSNNELPILISYNDIMGEIEAGYPGKSELYEVISESPGSDDVMPPSPRQPLTSEQISLIEIWILEGAKNTTCPDQNCDSVNVTYSGTISTIMQNCTGCHGTNSPSAGLSLTTYAQVKDAINGKHLIDRVNFVSGYSPMPPSGIKLSTCNLAQLRHWIELGMPNN
jgi:hypothetical protein